MKIHILTQEIEDITATSLKIYECHKSSCLRVRIIAGALEKRFSLIMNWRDHEVDRWVYPLICGSTGKRKIHIYIHRLNRIILREYSVSVGREGSETRPTTVSSDAVRLLALNTRQPGSVPQRSRPKAAAFYATSFALKQRVGVVRAERSQPSLVSGEGVCYLSVS